MTGEETAPLSSDGPLAGVRIVELAAEGPGAYGGMLLADLGADVVRIDRLVAVDDGRPRRDTVLGRGRRSVAVDLKHPDGIETVLRLVDGADALLEGFRPGTAERLGLGPEVCLARNPRLVYGRMTGWGQTGPLAMAAGHDINFIALAGLLGALGRYGQPPTPPLAIAGDMGGGGAFLALGVVSALFEAQRSGRGQVVDAAVIDGAASLMGVFYGLRSAGHWNDERGTNLLDSGAPFYDAYETADGRYVAIGPMEPKFFAQLLERMGLAEGSRPGQYDRDGWPELRKQLAETFRTRTRAQWCEELEGTDACFAPVLTLGEAPEHPHHVARGTFVDVDGTAQPAPAPRLSRTPGAVRRPAPGLGEHTIEALSDWGFDEAELARLADEGVVRQAPGTPR
ncbi:MAG TPA: CaiB/BaiF CoA-transferase family protein [Acidimicrobiia bacterium]|nr:CaiB/BaiF CoA-transferase family protein [Acidimicrobiia bacterium]